MEAGALGPEFPAGLCLGQQQPLGMRCRWNSTLGQHPTAKSAMCQLHFASAQTGLGQGFWRRLHIHQLLRCQHCDVSCWLQWLQWPWQLCAGNQRVPLPLHDKGCKLRSSSAAAHPGGCRACFKACYSCLTVLRCQMLRHTGCFVSLLFTCVRSMSWRLLVAS